VADYTATVARALAEAGEEVHVWCGGREGEPACEAGVFVHRSLGSFDRAGLAAADAHLQRLRGSRRLLVQWVPHAFGRRSLNVAFCRWVRRRVRRHGDRLDVMVHEPFLPFSANARQAAAAAVHRFMAGVLLGAATRVWVATAGWEMLCRRYAPQAMFEWLPVPSGIPVTADEHAAADVRRELALASDLTLVGAFGRFGAGQESVLMDTLDALEAAGRPAILLLIGAGSEAARSTIAARRSDLAGRVLATGFADAAAVSRYLRACELLVQPYLDGISGRRSSASAALAHGCPMVTTEGRFTEPLWRDSAAVRLVPAGDPARFAEAVVALSRDREERSGLSQRARALYDARFHVRHTVAALTE
jgi:glycosyltransferase involved in cell wall biosynthesis